MHNRQLRNWVFTVNNPEAILDPSEWPNCRMAVWQLEMSDNGTPHYQGYVEYTIGVRRRTVSSCSGLEGAYLNQRLGSRQQAINYSTKNDHTFLEGPWWWPSEAGAMINNQGNRTDLKSFVDRIIAGSTDTELLASHPVQLLKFGRHAQTVRNAIPPLAHVERPYDCEIFWGPTHTGKSYRLRQLYPEGTEWFWMRPGKWWDGYQGQPGVVFDDITDSWMTFNTLIRVLMHSPRRVEMKGSVIPLRAYKFRMSSNVHPKKWYKNVNIHHPWNSSPLRSRFSRILHMPNRVVIEGIALLQDDDEPDSDDGPPELVEPWDQRYLVRPN